MRLLKNESGITLIEVLATLTITAIIGSVVYAVFFQTLHANEKTKAHNELRQEANIVMTQLRTMHEKGDSIWYISDMLYKDAEKNNPLSTENDFNITKVQINDTELVSGDSKLLSPELSFKVALTIKDHFQNQYELVTVLSSNKRIKIPQPPSTTNSFYTYLVDNNVFVNGSSIVVSGSTVDGAGTIIINNNSNLDFIFDDKKNEIDIPNIYIDRTGNNVIFEKNTQVGKDGVTKVVSINGDVELNHGGGKIIADIVYIDGNVNLAPGAKIEGGIVIITGNVESNNNNITATEKLYTGAEVNSELLSKYSQIIYPNITIPTLQNDSWFTDPLNGYKLSNDVPNGMLQDEMKIFASNSYTYNDINMKKNEVYQNVVIVSKKDINIQLGKDGNFTGVLFAPLGKVTFEGSSFKGVVIAANGFEVANEGTSVTFINIDNYFTKDGYGNILGFPFQ